MSKFFDVILLPFFPFSVRLFRSTLIYMVSWSTRRKAVYSSIILGVLVLVTLGVFLIWYYEPPTCFDSKKNGDETGVDCGGTCTLLCHSDALSPIILWQRVFKVSPGVYNVVAYVQNPNVNSEVKKAPYTFSVFNSRGTLLAKRSGTTFIPPNKKFAVFEGALTISSGVPTRVVFEFNEPLVWKISARETPEIVVKSAELIKADSTPRIDAILQNNSIIDARNVEAVVIVSDEKGNALGSSKTVVEKIPKSSEATVVFTWPAPFEAETSVCKRPVDVVLVIDRSGSMDDDKQNPPQPLTDVKDAALVFVDELAPEDRAGLVSFGTTATNPPDKTLTADLSSLKDVIRKIMVILNGEQNTNIGEGIVRAHDELSSFRHNSDSGKVIVLLTDGVATHPQKADDELFPEKYAEFEASAAKRDNINIFTIGLGNKVNNDFLKRISSGSEFNFSTGSSENLSSIYKQIASEICKKGPVIIEIFPLVEGL